MKKTPKKTLSMTLCNGYTLADLACCMNPGPRVSNPHKGGPRSRRSLVALESQSGRVRQQGPLLTSEAVRVLMLGGL
jgi:hypothetical protein